MPLLGIVLIIIALVALARIAMHPVRALIATVRVLSFLVGLAAILAYFSLDMPPSDRETVLWNAAGGFGMWILTFILPAIGRALRDSPRR